MFLRENLRYLLQTKFQPLMNKKAYKRHVLSYSPLYACIIHFSYTVSVPLTELRFLELLGTQITVELNWKQVKWIAVMSMVKMTISVALGTHDDPEGIHKRCKG